MGTFLPTRRLGNAHGIKAPWTTPRAKPAGPGLRLDIQVRMLVAQAMMTAATKREKMRDRILRVRLGDGGVFAGESAMVSTIRKHVFEIVRAASRLFGGVLCVGVVLTNRSPLQVTRCCG